MAADITTLVGYTKILKDFAKQADLSDVFGDDLINAAIRESLLEMTLKADFSLHYLKTNSIITISGTGDDINGSLPSNYLTVVGSTMRVKLTDGTTYKLIQIVRSRSDFPTNSLDDRRVATIDEKKLQLNPGSNLVASVFLDHLKKPTMLNPTPLNDTEFVDGMYFKSMNYTLYKLYSSQLALEEQRQLGPQLYEKFLFEIGVRSKESKDEN